MEFHSRQLGCLIVYTEIKGTGSSDETRDLQLLKTTFQQMPKVSNKSYSSSLSGSAYFVVSDKYPLSSMLLLV